MEAGEDDKAWTAEDETVEKEAVTLFISMMQTLPPEFKHSLLIKALKECGPACLEGVEEARDAILYSCLRMEPKLLGHISSYVDKATNGSHEGEEADGVDEDVNDTDDEGFADDLEYAKTMYADLHETQAAGHDVYSKEELDDYASSVFGPTSSLRPPRIHPSQQPSNYGSSFRNAYSTAAAVDTVEQASRDAQSTHVNEFLNGLLGGPDEAGPLDANGDMRGEARELFQQMIREGVIGLDGFEMPTHDASADSPP